MLSLNQSSTDQLAVTLAPFGTWVSWCENCLKNKYCIMFQWVNEQVLMELVFYYMAINKMAVHN